jgi:uncharacterized membrane protein YpjA
MYVCLVSLVVSIYLNVNYVMLVLSFFIISVPAIVYTNLQYLAHNHISISYMRLLSHTT